MFNTRNFEEQVAARTKERVFLSKMREEMKSSFKSQSFNITDEEKAMLNAADFIEVLKDKSTTKKGALKLVKLFIVILRRKVKERN